MAKNSVSLKDHYDALRAADERQREADQRAIDLVREWTKERLLSHNGLIDKMDRDRALYASRDTVDALKDAFDAYKDITAKALTLAEGKSKGFDSVRVGMAFVAALAVASVTVWLAVRGIQ